MRNRSFSWSKKFSIYDIENLGVFFVSENDFVKLQRETYTRVNDCIQQGKTISDYIFHESCFISQMKKLREIERLESDGLITYNDIIEPYLVPEPTLVTDKVSSKLQMITLTSLAPALFIKYLVDALSTELFEHELTIIIVDDYLNPKLPKVIEGSNSDVLLIKPFGERQYVGPLLHKENNVSPCIHCLQSYLLENKPVYQLVLDKCGSLPSPPTFYAQKNIDSIINKATEIISKKQFNYLFELIEKKESVHLLNQHESCQHFPIQPLLTSNKETCNPEPIADKDGGYRTISREETISLIEPFVSPIIGLISTLDSVVENDALSIYQTAYFKSPYGLKHIDSDSFVELGLGKGLSNQQSKCSALGEALERKLGQYRKSISTLYATTDQLEYRFFLPQQLSQFSQIQYGCFELYDSKSLRNPQWVEKYDYRESIHWTKGWSLTSKESVYFPSAYCFANTPFDDAKYSMYCHNGNASGYTHDEAVLQGLLELVERDAVSIWWYNQIPRPSVNLEILNADELQIFEEVIGQEWSYWALDVTNDIGINCIVGVAEHKQTKEILLGFGCHLEEKIALSRSLTELYQLITIKDKVTGPFDFKKIKHSPFLYPANNTQPVKKLQYEPKIRSAISTIVEQLAKRDIEVCVVDYSSPVAPLKTLKVIAPGLCHFWPRYANKRLYQVPVTQNWLVKKLDEQELNPLELYL